MKNRFFIFICFFMAFLFIYIMYEVGESSKDSPSSFPTVTEQPRVTEKPRGLERTRGTTTPIPEVTLDVKEIVKGYIFVGDSRFVGMDNVCSIDDSSKCFVVAKEAEGYNWLIDDALNSIISIQDKHRDINTWSLVIGLGINDLYNIENYMYMYENLDLDFDVVLVSVNPIEYHNSITNENIIDFNEKLKTIDCVKYIDTYSYLMLEGYSTTDGIHYTDETYSKIYKYIKKDLNNYN